jgi:PAS domain S-box-containing protein
MSEDRYVARELDRLLHEWSVRAAAIGAAIFLLLSPLDYLSFPEQFTPFLRYRVGAALALLGLAFLARATRDTRALKLWVLLAVLASAVTVEAMILRGGGHQSPYYAGMILLGVVALGMIPAGLGFNLLLAGSIVAVYLVPLLLWDEIVRPRTLATQTYFLVFILAAMALIRHLNRAQTVGQILRSRALAEKELELSQIVDVKTEQLINASREWRATVDATGDRILLVDGEDRIVKANLATAELAGRTLPELLGTPVSDIVPEAELPRSVHPLAALRRTGERAQAEFRVPALGRSFLMTAEPTRAGSGAEGGAVLIIHDVSERKAMMDELHAAAVRMQGILARAPFGVFIVDGNLRVEFANPAILAITGYPRDEFVGACLADFPGCAELGMREQVLGALRGVPFRFGPATFHCRRAERAIHGQFTGIPVEEGGEAKVLLFVEDLTGLAKAEEERHRLAAMLLQAQKMESIGTLASGIAHDFNNILLAVIGMTDAAGEQLPAAHPAREHLESVIAAAERGSDLVKQLLAFSRQQELLVRPVDLLAVVDETRKLLRHMLPQNVIIDIMHAGRVPPVLADPVQLEQVLMNLAINARDAMPEGGTLAIGTGTVELGPDEAGLLGLPPGPFVLLTVEDSGCGMPPELQERIFDPFFTTKETGKGTGLGLATVYGIVTQHGGTVRVESAPGKGSAFRVYLPAAAREAPGTGGCGAPAVGGTETILLVEDDDAAREVIAGRLAQLGYRVLTAAGGEEALQACAAAGGAVDLLLCDVVLPGMTARAVARELGARVPGLRAVFVSGYPEQLLLDRALLGAGDRLVGKGLGPDGIARRVREVLDGAVL